MDNVCGKDLFSPDMVPLNHDTPIRADGDTQAEDDGRKGLCSPKMVDEHPPSVCPYRKRVPKNATIGRGCVLLCSVCHRFFGGSCCGQDEAYASFKVCCICGKIGEHWSTMCPSPLRQEKDISFNNGLHSYYPGNKESLAFQYEV
ncbi:unnamed protein product [Prunus armeniaca]|uniref:Uncharacterized protein n=1 Tax=Prunus armeniaca TaxID=36596 RepID=A0A6J5X245_PRUAR|nr:unnamed protein product [Prunus armeniaca]